MNTRTMARRWERWAYNGRAYRQWYRVARVVLRRLADHSGVDYNLLCDIVAITSPRCAVNRNLKVAYGEVTGRERPSDMIQSTRAALGHYYKTGEIRGPKTSRFANVLRGDDNVVVVDTWMKRTMGVPDNARGKDIQITADKVARIVQRRLRRSTGHAWKLSEVQAAVWAGFIRSFYDEGTVPVYRTDYVGLAWNRATRTLREHVEPEPVPF